LYWYHRLGRRRIFTGDGVRTTRRSHRFFLTVLHDLLRDNTGEVVLRETARVLKPEGKLVIVEYKKIETPSGPPVTMRLSEQELGEITTRFGFRKERVSEVGAYHYLYIASIG
jgi:ubiquinone/menaquinone biosynthesis C-methylase UbiE